MMQIRKPCYNSMHSNFHSYTNECSIYTAVKNVACLIFCGVLIMIFNTKSIAIIIAYCRNVCTFVIRSEKTTLMVQNKKNAKRDNSV